MYFIGAWSTTWGRHNEKTFAPQLAAYHGSSSETWPDRWDSTTSSCIGLFPEIPMHAYGTILISNKIMIYFAQYQIIPQAPSIYHLLFDPISLGLGSTMMSRNVENRTTFCSRGSLKKCLLISLAMSGSNHLFNIVEARLFESARHGPPDGAWLLSRCGVAMPYICVGEFRNPWSQAHPPIWKWRQIWLHCQGKYDALLKLAAHFIYCLQFEICFAYQIIPIFSHGPHLDPVHVVSTYSST